MEHRFKIIGIGFIIVALTSTIYAGHPGVGAYQNQAYEQAKEQFKASLLDDPDNGKITYNLGNAYFKLGDHDRSIKAYEEAVKTLPEKKKINAYYNLGTAHLKNNNMKDALDAYKEVLKRDPTHLKTRQNIELVLRQESSPSQSSGTASNQDDRQDDQKNNPENNQTNDSDNQSEGAEADQEQVADATDEKTSEDEDGNGEEDVIDKAEALSEQQIQYLVDRAEKDAREKRKKNQDALFEAAKW